MAPSESLGGAGGSRKGNMSIPKILHYCWGMTNGPAEKPWSLVHYVCLRSAIQHIKPDVVQLYYEFEPQTAWWTLTEPLVKKIAIKAPNNIHGRPLYNPAHRADVVRLMALIECGGIYLDADIMVHRSFDPLLSNYTVLGQEGPDGYFGVSNAVILSRPHSVFLSRWLEQYRWFRGGKDHNEPFWNEHSVQLPSFMARLFPSEITVVDDRAFYWPLWASSDIDLIFTSSRQIDISRSYATHLWESQSWSRLKDLTPGQVRARDTNFSRWARPYLSDLPDNFGVESGRFSNLNLSTSTSVARKSAGPVAPRAGSMARQTAFQQTYAQRLWGDDGQSQFFSGIGSRGSAVTAYVDAIGLELEALRSSLGRKLVIVDVGCGDFAVGKEITARWGDQYIGCDIVPELVEFNTRTYACENVSFRNLDAVVDALPDADVYLIREVLQHLTNTEINQVIDGLKDRLQAAIYVTEAQPRHVMGAVNPDKPLSGADIRFDWRTGIGRGVELDQAPYNISVKLICRAEMQKQFISTFKIVWSQ